MSGVQWVHKRPSRWLGVLVVGQALAALLFGWLAVTLRDPLAAALAVLAAGGAVWHASVLLRVRRAQSQGAVPLQRSDGSADPSFPQPLSVEATQTQGARSRRGWILVVGNVAAFVPTSPWRHLALRLLGGLLTVRVPLVRIVLARPPRSRDELVAMAHAEGGFVIDETWAWDPSGRMLIRAGGQDILMSRLPLEQRARWATMASDPIARQRVLRKVVSGGLAVALVLAGAGALAWRLTGNVDFLVAGLSFAALVAIAVAGGVYGASRATG